VIELTTIQMVLILAASSAVGGVLGMLLLYSSCRSLEEDK